MYHRYVWLVGILLIAASAFLFLPSGKGNATPPVRLPTKLASLDGRYYSFVERDPRIGADNVRLLSDYSLSGDKARQYVAIIEFGRSLPLSRNTGLNAALHALMTFGSSHPVYVEEGKAIPVLDFIRNYYDHLPPEIRRYAPSWIHRVDNEYFLTMTRSPRIIADHLGQLAYVCAISGIPIETTFQLKSGNYLSLEQLFATEMKYADPDWHDPTWQTAAVAYYWPDKSWKNINKKDLSSMAFLARTVSRVAGHATCGHTHSLISAAYAISHLEGSAVAINGHGPSLGDCRRALDSWLNMIQETLYPDGTVSQKWYLNERAYPQSVNEVVMLNGHVLECLAAYSDGEQLRSPWVTHIVDRFCDVVTKSIRAYATDSSSEREQHTPFEYAALCHGIRGLSTYCNAMRIASNARKDTE